MVTGVGFALFALGLTLVFGVLRVINMAHGEFYMLGGMIVYSLMAYLGMNYFLVLALSTILVGILGVIVNRVAIQPLLGAPILSTLLSTIAASVIILNGAFIAWGGYAKDLEFPFPGVWELGGVRITQASVLVLVIGVIVIAALYFSLTKIRWGRATRATAQNLVGASLVGINVKRIYVSTFALAASLAAVAGGLVGLIMPVQPNMGQSMLLKGFAVVIVAGMGDVRGCIVIGLILGITEALFAQYISAFYRDAWAYGIMLLILVFRPQGLFGRR